MGGQGDAQTRLCASCRAAEAHEWLAEERAPSEIVKDRGQTHAYCREELSKNDQVEPKIVVCCHLDVPSVTYR